MLKLFYGRVSTDKEDGRAQTLEQQLDAARIYGVAPDDCYLEKASGATNLETGAKWLALKGLIAIEGVGVV